jgi:hypothetical protein
LSNFEAPKFQKKPQQPSKKPQLASKQALKETTTAPAKAQFPLINDLKISSNNSISSENLKK